MSELHRCARGRQCHEHEIRDDGRGGQRRLGAAIDAPEGLCRACERVVGRALGELPALYVDLAAIVGQHRQAGEHVSHTRALPTPARLDVLALQADIDATVCAWAAPVAARCAITWYTPALAYTRAGYRVARAARLLASQLDALLGLRAVQIAAWVPGWSEYQPPGRRLLAATLDGREGALRLLALHQRGRQLVSGGTGDARLPVPCPSCEAPALVRANGADQVTCRGCGNSWPEKDYRRLCLILAENYADEEVRS
jgi:hypothetical protein